jgi:hypothetical protein
MGAMGLGLVWTFGALGWIGWPQDSVLQVLAPLILIVGVSDAIHILSRNAVEVLQRGGAPDRQGRSEAVLAAARDVGPPCLMTSLTTAGAFLSFLTSDLATFVHFGVISAFGVGACLVVTFTLIPLLLRWLPTAATPAQSTAEAWNAALSAVANTVERRARPILIASVLLFVVCVIGWAEYLRVDTDPNAMWGDRNRVTRWIHFVDQRLRGLDSLEIDVALPSTSPIEAPETQEHLQAFSRFLEGTDGLGRATSVQVLISRMNRLLHDDDPAFDHPGSSNAENGEILGLIELDGPDLLGLWLGFDHSRFRISVEGPSDSARGRGRVLNEIREFVRSELPADWQVTLTGPFAMEFDWVTQMQDTQIRSFAAAFTIVFACLAIFLKSARLGLGAMIPAVMPVVITLGFMGFAGLSLDVGRVMIAAIVIGIAVDDSVHLLNHYRRRRDRGDDPAAAIRASILHVGRAVVVTSASLALGFLTLMTSAWQSISSFGFFVSVAILGALVASLFILPATILVFQGRPNHSSPETQR